MPHCSPVQTARSMYSQREIQRGGFKDHDDYGLPGIGKLGTAYTTAILGLLGWPVARAKWA